MRRSWLTIIFEGSGSPPSDLSGRSLPRLAAGHGGRHFAAGPANLPPRVNRRRGKGCAGLFLRDYAGEKPISPREVFRQFPENPCKREKAVINW